LIHLIHIVHILIILSITFHFCAQERESEKYRRIGEYLNSDYKHFK